MAFVLPHAAVLKTPPAASLKVPAASVPLKAAADAHGADSPALKFQALLDHAAQAKKAAAEPGPAPAKTPKAKAAEAPVEKPRDPKKAETKDHRTDPDASAAALLVHQPKTEPPKPAAKAEAEAAVQAAADKAKGGRQDRRTADAPQAVTVAALETARSQGAPNALRSDKADRGEEKQKVFVVDRRNDKEKDKLKAPGAETAANLPVNAAVEVQAQAKPVDGKSPSADVQVQFQTVGGKPRDSFDLKPQASAPSPRDAVSFQQYLVDKGYGQLVDNARIVLKDQNAGEIRMTLYPESLGKVKVALNLDDSSLAGQIFVENQTVKDVFQSNMDGLLQAFQDGGWTDVSLQVSVGGESGAGTQNRQPQTGAQARDYGRQASQTTLVGDRGDRIGSWNDRQINLTA